MLLNTLICFLAAVYLPCEMPVQIFCSLLKIRLFVFLLLSCGYLRIPDISPLYNISIMNILSALCQLHWCFFLPWSFFSAQPCGVSLYVCTAQYLAKDREPPTQASFSVQHPPLWDSALQTRATSGALGSTLCPLIQQDCPALFELVLHVSQSSKCLQAAILVIMELVSFPSLLSGIIVMCSFCNI